MASPKQRTLLREELQLDRELIDSLTQNEISIIIDNLEQLFKNTAGDPAARQMAKNTLVRKIEAQKAKETCGQCHKLRVPANTEFTCSC